MAWDIFTSAFSSLTGRLGAAIKASLLPMIILLLTGGGLILGVNLTTYGQANSGGAILALILVVLAVFVIILFCFSWVAVLWHRAAILEQDPGFIPNYKAMNVPAYAGRLVVLGLVIMAALIPFVLVLGFIGGIFGVSVINSGVVGLTIAGTILNLIFGAILTFIWLRISATLPGIAIGRRLTISEGWRATADIAGPIFGVACIMTLLNLLISIATLALSLINPLIMQLIQLPMSWFLLMLGMSVMTEIYRRNLHIDTAADVFE